ncbi:MAG: hypothetical protein HY314_16905 [Acidobacteria bacterium]|nr:hypothetical protein [Acidobacteriota bacterium]
MQSQIERRLILCVDGIPYTAIERLRHQGMFRFFQSPSRIISPFPAMTNVALKELFGAASPSGYEAFYFDRELNRLSGGASNYIRRRTQSLHVRTYHHFVDYQEPVHFEFLVYVAPQAIYRADLDRFLARFQASDAPMVVGYLKSTDGLIHLGGQEKLDWALRLLDEALTTLMDAHRGKMEITLFSDHGNNMVGGRRLKLKDHLRRCHYQVGSRLRSEPSVVVPEFGLVSFAAVYTASDPAPMARDLAQLDGVEFAVYRQADAVVVAHQSGQAKIAYEPALRRYRYEPNTSDPLNLQIIMQQLKDQGQADAEGFIGDRALFEATADHHFPDAVHRLHQAMSDQVVNQADILLSLADGVYVGHALFDSLVELVATHGSARASSSTGFLMSTHRVFSTCLRASNVPVYLNLKPRC